MYHYVEDKEFLKRAQRVCSNLVVELEEALREEGINSQFFLIGSGGRNMVTQNEEGPIDFDYNLNILSCDDFNDCKVIKETVRWAFNKVLRNNGLSDCDDSTSSLTTKHIHFNGDDDSNEFSIDVGIVTKGRNGNWNRLKHEKSFIGFMCYQDRYYWNEGPNLDKCKEKAMAIKLIPGCWDYVRDRYLELKNHYLRSNDYNHPSFVCYIQTVNDAYNHMKQKGLFD